MKIKIALALFTVFLALIAMGARANHITSFDGTVTAVETTVDNFGISLNDTPQSASLSDYLLSSLNIADWTRGTMIDIPDAGSTAILLLMALILLVSANATIIAPTQR